MAMVATKGNLMTAKNTLELCKTGYELLDKKRNILIREMMGLIESAKHIQAQIDATFSEAYTALQRANIELGIDEVQRMAISIEVEKSVEVKFRSVMGVQIPVVAMKERNNRPVYSFKNTTSSLDEAYLKFGEVKRLAKILAEIENSIFRLADSIKKTQKRANALKNIMIPKYEEETKNIQNALEEKEREEFSRLKVIKTMKSEE